MTAPTGDVGPCTRWWRSPTQPEPCDEACECQPAAADEPQTLEDVAEALDCLARGGVADAKVMWLREVVKAVTEDRDDLWQTWKDFPYDS